MQHTASLSKKLIRIGASLLVLALASIGLTLWVTWQLEGGAAAVNEAGIETGQAMIINCDGTEDKITEQILILLRQPNRPDGIIASVEKLVPPVYFACKELGINIPEEIRLIGFTNLTASPILNPSLSTVTQPAFEIGKTAAALLFKGIEKTSFDLSREKLIIPSQLQLRDSTL